MPRSVFILFVLIDSGENVYPAFRQRERDLRKANLHFRYISVNSDLQEYQHVVI